MAIHVGSHLYQKVDDKPSVSQNFSEIFIRLSQNFFTNNPSVKTLQKVNNYQKNVFLLKKFESE
jgi:hypothetical protein